jgi:polysaccharide biosynthesis protein PslH
MQATCVAPGSSGGDRSAKQATQTLANSSDIHARMSERRLKILTVLPYLPEPPDNGGKTRSLNLIRHLSRSDEIFLVSFVRDEDEARHADALRPFCREVHVIRRNPARSPRIFLRHMVSSRTFYEEVYWRRSAAKFLQQLVAANQFDVVHLECSYLAAYLDVLPRGRRFLLDPNVEYRIFERYRETSPSPFLRLLLGLEARRVRHSEQRAWREADLCGTVSETDREEVLRSTPRKVVWVIPNGVDCPEPASDPAGTRPHQLLLTGNFTYFANLDAAAHLVRDILPHVRNCAPEAEIHFVGRGAGEKLTDLSRQAGVRTTDWVPEFAPYLANAAVYVCPLRIGSGTKLKMLEAMAASKAIVATSIAAEGLAVRNGEHILIADAVEDFAGAVCRLLNDADLRRRLGRAAYALAKSEYAWDSIAAKLRNAYLSMQNNEPGGTAAGP